MVQAEAPPALTVDELPPLHAVVLSHMHGDHWDRVAEKGLDHDLPIVTTHAAAKRLHSKGFTLHTGWTPGAPRRSSKAVTG